MESENTEISLPELTQSTSSPNIEPANPDSGAKKRIFSDDSDIAEDPKRQNLNTSKGEPSTDSNSGTPNQKSINLDSSIYDQLEISFENEPFWVPLLIRSFDALNKEIRSISSNLNQEVKALSTKFDVFSSEMSERIVNLENDVTATKKSLAENSKKVTRLESETKNLAKQVIENEKAVKFFSEVFDDVKKEKDQITEKTSDFQNTFSSLIDQTDRNEQHNRNQCLLLHGVPEGSQETPLQSKTLFTKTIVEKLDIKFTADCIQRAHRLGQKRSNGKPRPIIARIYDPQLRNDIYFNKKRCRGTPFSITENLTQRRMQMKIKAENEFGSTNVWTKEGRIYAKDENGVIKTILS